MNDKINPRDIRGISWYWADMRAAREASPQIGAIPFAVYTQITAHANQDQMAWPGIGTLARLLKITPPTVIKALKVLENYGLIRVTRQTTAQGQKLANVYFLVPFPLTPIHRNTDEQAAEGGVVNDVYEGSKPGLLELYPLNYNHITIGAEIPAELSADTDANFASREPLEKLKPNGKAKPKVEKPRGTEKPITHRELVSKLIEVCGWNGSALLPSNYSLLGKVAKNLAAIGVAPEDLAVFLAWWWQEDFRGKTGQRPTPPLIESVWPLFSARRQIVKPPQSKTIRIIDPLTGKTIEVDSSTGT